MLSSIPPTLRRSMLRHLRGRARNVTTSANDIAARLCEEHRGTSLLRTQRLDPHQAQKLSLMLNRRQLHPNVSVESSVPVDGTPLPPGYHLVYFTPTSVESDLGIDGTDNTFNPGEPFTRRMWAGGELRWEANNPMRVGQTVDEKTRLVSATGKRSRSGHELLLVEVEKRFSNQNGLCLLDKRSWIFQPETATRSKDQTLDITQASKPLPYRTEIMDVLPEDGGPVRRSYKWSPIALFRFSALTYNAHMIHFSDPWCYDKESLPGIVVHGPLNLINMLDYWRDQWGTDGKKVKSITYRAMAPIYAGSTYEIGLAPGGEPRDSTYDLLVSSGAGVTNMQGKVVSEEEGVGAD